MTGAEHPLIAADRTHATPDLVGQGLKAQAVVRGGQGAGDAVAWSVGGLDGQKYLDSFLKTTFEQV